MRSQHPIVSHHLPSKILIFWYPKCSDIAVLIDVWVFSRGVSLATGTQISRHQDLLDRAFGWRDKNKQIARCFLRSGTPQGTWIRLFVASECIWWVLRNPNSRKKSHLPNGFKSFLPVCVYWVHWDMFNPLHVCQFLQGWPVGIISKSMPFACRFRVAVVNLMPPMVWWSQMVPSGKQKTETLRRTLSPGDSRNKVLGPVHPATFWKRKCLTAAVSTIDWDQSSTKDPNSQVLTLNGVSNLWEFCRPVWSQNQGWMVGGFDSRRWLPWIHQPRN